MRYQLKCECGATCWASGDDEPNACTIDDYDLEWFGGRANCDHHEWEIVDSEYPEPIGG